MESSILTLISPSGKLRSRGSVSWTSRISAIFPARSMLALPEISLSSPQGELSALVYSTAVCSLPINRLSPYHPSGNSDRCRAVRDVLGHHRARPAARLRAQFDGRHPHRVHAHEGTVKLGKQSRTGAGSVVTKDVPDGATAVGVPAR